MPRTPESRPTKNFLVSALTTTAIVAGSLLIASSASATGSQTSSESSISSWTIDKTPQQLRTFWTPERLRQAAANPAPTPEPQAKSKGGKKGTSAGAETSLTAWATPEPPVHFKNTRPPIEALATVSVSQRVSNVSSWPTSAVGRLFYSNQAETQWFTCSGTSISTNNQNSVWTAAHCLHAGSGGSAGWYRNFIFIPAYSFSSNPYGWFTGVSVLAHNDWTNGGDTTSSDMGILTVSPPSGSPNLTNRVGAWGYRFIGETGFTNARSYGYPALGYNRPDSDFADGEYMMYCEGDTTDAANLNPFDNRIQMNCDMGGGASGGPMAINVSSSPTIVGTNSHRYADSLGNYADIRLFSSNHSLIASALINHINNS
ncbi:hypothetical protein O7543_17205 [Solwaraspora sp. WMMA2080]|uniref:trypsin-like serine peptidase n=1 Tax=Micromonosporaceae TaxID=28056 RepID=UPI00248B98AD|nr:hypothetical protein [Solwaraspora sp. WMMA2080]WBC18662.1 hypothetical protein O7543_17205 [Solwaraspora sp. WMMA2080]